MSATRMTNRLVTSVMKKNATRANDSTQLESHWFKKHLLSAWIKLLKDYLSYYTLAAGHIFLRICSRAWKNRVAFLYLWGPGPHGADNCCHWKVYLTSPLDTSVFKSVFPFPYTFVSHPSRVSSSFLALSTQFHFKMQTRWNGIPLIFFNAFKIIGDTKDYFQTLTPCIQC